MPDNLIFKTRGDGKFHTLDLELVLVSSRVISHIFKRMSRDHLEKVVVISI